MRAVAQFISVLFHPLILLNFGLYSILRFHPYFVSKFYDAQFYTLSMFIAINTLIMPLLSTYLLKRFGFISDFAMSNPAQRLLPYSVFAILLGVTLYQLYRIELTGLPMVFLSATIICVVLNILINTRFTISTHTIGAGGLTALYFFLTFFGHLSVFNVWLIVSVLLAGISSWSRLYLNAHSEKQIYTGLLLGFVTVTAVLLLFA